MTESDPKANDVSMNDTLVTSNPSMRSILIVLGLCAIGALILMFRESLGF